MSNQSLPDPENCPQPFWHETPRYCPACSWSEGSGAEPLDAEPLVERASIRRWRHGTKECFPHSLGEYIQVDDLPKIIDQAKREERERAFGSGRWEGKTRDEVIALLEERLGRRAREYNEAKKRLGEAGDAEIEHLDAIHLSADQESIRLGAEGNHLGEFEAKGIASTAERLKRRLVDLFAALDQEDSDGTV